MKLTFKTFLWSMLTAMLVACTPASKQDRTQYLTVSVACDETFRPIMEQEMRAFHAKYPEAIMDTLFLPETDALNLVLQDSFRMVISTRQFNEQEKQYLMDKFRLVVESQPFAYDAIALIINKQNTDSLLSVNELRSILTGKLTQWNEIQHAQTKGAIEVVFDNENSSTVRFLRDSLCGGTELKGNLKTAHSNKNVIDYVRQTRNAIGIIGVDWIRNPEDTTNLTFDDHVRVMSVSHSAVTTESNSARTILHCHQGLSLDTHIVHFFHRTLSAGTQQELLLLPDRHRGPAHHYQVFTTAAHRARPGAACGHHRLKQIIKKEYK